jgi:PTS system mannose-specific IIC component
MGWRDVEKGNFKKLYGVNWGWPWISHLLFSFIPTLVMCKWGADAVTALKTALPMDGIPMKTLFTVGAMLPCVGIAILLKQIVETPMDFVPFFVGFTLAASLSMNLVSCAVVSLIFALLFYNLEMAKNARAVAPASGGTIDDDDDDDEEDI